MRTELRVAVVGCGHVARKRHLPVLQEMEGVAVTALVDSNPGRLAEAGEQFGVAARYQEVEQMLGEAAVDLVAVCVPAAFHRQVAVAALEAGKHVFIEKPLALTVEECDAIIASVRADRRAFMGFQLRHHRLVRQAREMLRAGVAGTVEAVRSVHAGFHASLPAWRERRSTGGGVIYEQAVHHFDMWRYLLETEVKEVYAAARSEGWDDAAVSVTARLANGAVVSALFSERTTAANEVEVLGRQGRLRLSGYRFDGLRFEPVSSVPGSVRERIDETMHTLQQLPDGLAALRGGGDYDAAFREQWTHCRRVIQGEAKQECTLEDGRRAVAIVEAAAESDRTERTVRVGAG